MLEGDRAAFQKAGDCHAGLALQRHAPLVAIVLLGPRLPLRLCVLGLCGGAGFVEIALLDCELRLVGDALRIIDSTMDRSFEAGVEQHEIGMRGLDHCDDPVRHGRILVGDDRQELGAAIMVA